MTLLRLSTFEHSEFEYEIVQERKDYFKNGKIYLSERAIEDLEKINKANYFADIRRRKIKILNYAGVVSFGNIRLEILPKFIRGESEAKILSPEEVKNREIILLNLLQMLKFTHRLEVKNADISPLSIEDDFLEIFINLFAKNLVKLLNSKRDTEYIKRYNELRFIRERIDTAKYCSNPARLNIIPCKFHERSMDTLINRTIKYTSYLLCKKVVNRNNFRLLRQILAILDPVSLIPIAPNYVSSINFNRLNIEFKPYIDFCEIILRKSSLALQGSEIEFFSILFPMQKLFEEFISNVIKHKKLYEALGCEKPPKIQQSIGYFVTKPWSSFQLIPDITLESNKEIYIIDMKYKMLDPEDRNLGISQQDLYQMFAYCKVLESNSKKPAKKVLLLYPEELNENGKKLEKKLTLVDEKEVYIRTIPLSINLKTELHKFSNYLGSVLESLQE